MTGVALITQNLGFGGVQRVVANLANYLVKHCRVSIILFEDKPPEFDLDAGIRIIALPGKRLDPHIVSGEDRELKVKEGEALYQYRVSLLRRVSGELDAEIFISFEDYNNMIAIDALRGGLDNRKLIVSSRVSIEHQYKAVLVHFLDFDFYKEGIRRLYKKADVVVSVSEGIKKELEKLGVASRVIRNGVDSAEVNRLAEEEVEFANYIVCSGRLNKRQKGQDDLIRAFAKISGSIRERLIIIGDGPDRSCLENLIADLELKDRIQIIGFTKNPYKYIKNAEMFVFPSYYEGFPNMLIEAMACGCACISYDFEPSGAEISGDGSYMKIVKRGDIAGLASAIEDFCNDDNKIAYYKERALERAEDFNMTVTLNKWHSLIDQIVCGRGPGS